MLAKNITAKQEHEILTLLLGGVVGVTFTDIDFYFSVAKTLKEESIAKQERILLIQKKKLELAYNIKGSYYENT